MFFASLGTLLTLSACAQVKSPGAEAWGYKIVGTYPHDVNAFTQGLAIVDGQMYEGTGGNGGSSLRKVDWKTGEVTTNIPLHAAYFGEGIAILGDRLYQLTWQNRQALVYDLKTLKLLGTFPYAGEGWGLTHNGLHLIMSDGTSNLRFIDPRPMRW